eukprot:1259165-Ditylum_brightwellii.AAC.1
MFSKGAILSFLLASASAHYPYPPYYEYTCQDKAGHVIYGEPCWRGWYGWPTWCTGYTCAEISCDNDYARQFCPETCGDCTTVVDIAQNNTSNSSIETLVDFLVQADLVSTLQGKGPFTVFAPTDEAFENLTASTNANYTEDQWSAHLKDLLLYHVVPKKILSSYIFEGATVKTLEGSFLTASLNPITINGAEVIDADLTAGNGVIHVIDEVLLPPSATVDIVDFLTTSFYAILFSTLVDLVVQVNLTDALQSPGPFTLFAPTNYAFSQIGDFIDVNNATQVTDVLLYHVLNGIVLAEDIDDDSNATTLSGETLSFDTLYNRFITINDESQVIIKDNLVMNGVIHVIDEVLIPPAYQPDI